MPERIQRRRTRGWRMPVRAVYVGRPTRWGNPFDWRDIYDHLVEAGEPHGTETQRRAKGVACDEFRA